MGFKVPTLDVIAGTTLRLTWTASGTIPTSLLMSILDKNEATVSTMTPVDSGNGHYYAPMYIPTSDRWYVGRSIAVIDARTYINRVLIQTHRVEAD
jgi:hypothetical protein